MQRHRPETNFADTEVEELIAMLRETENLEEQGDILQYLVDTQGLDFNTGMLFVYEIKEKYNKYYLFLFNIIYLSNIFINTLL